MKDKSLEPSYNLVQSLLEFNQGLDTSAIAAPEPSYINGTISISQRGLIELAWTSAQNTQTQVVLEDEISHAKVYDQKFSRGECVISGLALNRTYQLSMRSLSKTSTEKSSWLSFSIRVG